MFKSNNTGFNRLRNVNNKQVNDIFTDTWNFLKGKGEEEVNKQTGNVANTINNVTDAAVSIAKNADKLTKSYAEVAPFIKPVLIISGAAIVGYCATGIIRNVQQMKK